MSDRSKLLTVKQIRDLLAPHDEATQVRVITQNLHGEQATGLKLVEQQMEHRDGYWQQYVPGKKRTLFCESAQDEYEDPSMPNPQTILNLVVELPKQEFHNYHSAGGWDG